MTKLFIAAVLLCTAISCKKLITVDPPRTETDRSQVFRDEAGATAAATGLYARMTATTNTLFNGGITRFIGLSSDEIEGTVANSVNEVFSLNTIPIDNSTVDQTFWSAGYTSIFHANSVLEGLSESDVLSQGVKAQLTGEMLVLRSLFYFYSVNLFSDIPLITTTDLAEIEQMPRTPEEQVWHRITADLLQAKSLLSEDYPSTGKVRACKWAASALLARVYLYRKNWQAAENEASEVIGSGRYRLGALEETFLAGSSESILQLVMSPTSSLVTGDGTIFLPASASSRPAFALRKELLSAFEAGDKRLEKWIGKNTVSGITYNYPAKYRVRSAAAGTSRPEHPTVLRLAEQYLIRAEARAMLGNTEGAIADIDEVRARAGLPKIADTQPDISHQNLILRIAAERRVELFAEYGHRWFDLKRSGRIDEVLGDLKPTWKTYAALLPIPLVQIRLNPSLTQNTGYER